MQLIAYDAEPGPAQFEQLNRAVESAHPEVVIADSYRLDQASRAHERIEAGRVLGKIVLRVSA